MKSTEQNIFKKELDRLKRILEKIVRPKKEKDSSQLILQPVRNKKFEGY